MSEEIIMVIKTVAEQGILVVLGGYVVWDNIKFKNKMITEFGEFTKAIVAFKEVLRSMQGLDIEEVN